MASTSTAASDAPEPVAQPPAWGAGPAPGAMGVRVPARSLRGELRAVKVVWKRELIRFSHERLRIVASLMQPFLFLFVLGSGLARLAAGGTHGVNLRTFVYPGVLSMTVMLIAMFSAASLVWDREFGFVREMMVAPVRRGSIVLGKCLGGATVAGFEGVIVLCMAGLVGVPYAPLLILEVLALQLLVAFSITAFGVMLAVRITQVQSFMALTQMVMLPMYFLSGALFPVSNLPGWLAVLNRLDPLTYAVDPMRKAVFSHLHVSAAAKRALDSGVTWWGWQLPVAVEAGVVALLGLAMLAIAAIAFSRAE
jgi:ABC-2 type transport system permease protein